MYSQFLRQIVTAKDLIARLSELSQIDFFNSVKQAIMGICLVVKGALFKLRYGQV